MKCLLSHKKMPNFEDREIRAESIQAWIGMQKANFEFWLEETKIDAPRLFISVARSVASFVQETPSKVVSFFQAAATGLKSFFNSLPPIIF